MDTDLADFALKCAQDVGAQYAEVRLGDISDDTFVLKNGNPEVSGFERMHGISVRVLVNGSLGFATTNMLSRDSVKSIAQTSVRMARAGARLVKKKIVLSKEKAHVHRYIAPQKIKLQDITMEQKFEAIMDIERGMPKGVSVPARIFWLDTNIQEKYYTNSEGAKIHSVIPRILFFGIVTVSEGGKSEQGMPQYGSSKGWEYVAEVDMPSKISAEVRMLKNMMKNGKPAPKEKIDLVCGPDVVGIAVHESCGHPYEADRILGREAAQAGESFISQKMLGTRIGTDIVTVIDDPTMPGGYGHYLFDDEGVKARPRHLIRNGMINEFLQNRETGPEMGVGSNAASRATYYGVEPIVRMGNTYMAPGDHSFDELLEGIKEGVYLKSFTEWNIDDKRYNQKYVGKEAYLIQNGELSHPVSRAVLEITTPSFYASINAIGKNVERQSATCGKGEPAQGIPVDLGGPDIRLGGIKLGA